MFTRPPSRKISRENSVEIRDDVSPPRTVVTSNITREGRNTLSSSRRSTINETVETLKGKSHNILNDDLKKIMMKDPQTMSSDELQAVNTKLMTLLGLRDDLLSASDGLRSKISKLRKTLKEANGDVFEDISLKQSSSGDPNFVVSSLQRSLNLAKAQLNASKCQSEVQIIALQEELTKSSDLITSYEEKLLKEESVTATISDKLSINEDIRRGLVEDNSINEDIRRGLAQDNLFLSEDNNRMRLQGKEVVAVMKIENKFLLERIKHLEKSVSTGALVQTQLKNELTKKNEHEQSLTDINALLVIQKNDFEQSLISMTSSKLKLSDEVIILRKKIDNINSKLIAVELSHQTENAQLKDKYESEKEELIELNTKSQMEVIDLKDRYDIIHEQNEHIKKQVQDKTNIEKSMKEELRKDNEESIESSRVLSMKINDAEMRLEIMNQELLSVTEKLESRLKAAINKISLLENDMSEKSNTISAIEKNLIVLENEKADVNKVNDESMLQMSGLRQINMDLTEQIQFEKAQVHLKHEEVNVLKYNVKILQDENSKLTNDDSEKHHLREKIDELETSMSEYEKKLAVLKEEATNKSGVINNLEKEVSVRASNEINLSNELLLAQKDKAETQSEVAAMKSVKDRLINCNIQLEKKTILLEESLESKGSTINLLESELVELKKLPELDEETDIEIHDKIKSLNNELEIHSDTENKLKGNIEYLDKENINLRLELEQVCSFSTQAQIDNTELEEKLSTLQGSLDEQLSVNSYLETKLSDQLEECRDQKEQIDMFTKDCEVLRSGLEISTISNKNTSRKEEETEDTVPRTTNLMEIERYGLSLKEERNNDDTRQLHEEVDSAQYKFLSLKKELLCKEEAAKLLHSSIIALQNENIELHTQLDLEKEKEKSTRATESRNASVQTDTVETKEVSVETEQIYLHDEKSVQDDLFEDISFLKKNSMNDATGLLSLLQNHIAQTEIDNNKLKYNIESFQNRAVKLECTLASKSGANEQLNTDLKEAYENIYKYEDKLNKIEYELLVCKGKLLVAEKNEQDQLEVINNLRSEQKHIEASYNNASCELCVLMSTLGDLENKVRVNEEKSSYTRKELVKCQDEINSLRFSQGSSTAELDSYREKLIKLEVDTDLQIKMMDENNEVQALTMKILEKEVVQANRYLVTKQESEAILNSRVEFTDQWCKSLEKEIVVIGKEKSELRGKLCVVQHQVWYLEEKLQIKDSEDRVMKLMLKDAVINYEKENFGLTEESNTYQIHLAHTEEDLKICKLEKSTLIEELDASKEEISEMKRSLAICKDELEDKKKLLDESYKILEIDTEHLRNKLANSNEDLTYYKDKVKQIEIDSSILFGKFTSTQTQVKDLRSKLTESSNGITSIKQTLQDTQNVYDSKVNNLQSILGESKENHSCAEAQISILENNNTELIEKLDASHNESMKDKEDIDTLHTSLESCNMNVKELQTMLDEYHDKNESSEEHIILLQKQKIDLNGDLKVAHDHMCASEEKIAALEIEIMVTQKQVYEFSLQSDSDINKLVSKLNGVQESLTSSNICLLSSELTNQEMGNDLENSQAHCLELETKQCISNNELKVSNNDREKIKKYFMASILLSQSGINDLETNISELQERLENSERLTSVLEKSKIELFENLDVSRSMNENLKKELRLSKESVEEVKIALEKQIYHSASLEEENIKLVGNYTMSEQHVVDSELIVESLETSVLKLEEKYLTVREESDNVNEKLIESTSKSKLMMVHITGIEKKYQDVVDEKEDININLIKSISSFELLEAYVAVLEIQYQDVSEEKEIMVNKLIQSTLNFETEITDLKAKVKVVNELVASRDSELSSADEIESDLRQGISLLQNQNADLTDKVGTSEKKIEETEKLLDNLKVKNHKKTRDLKDKLINAGTSQHELEKVLVDTKQKFQNVLNGLADKLTRAEADREDTEALLVDTECKYKYKINNLNNKIISIEKRGTEIEALLSNSECKYENNISDLSKILKMSEKNQNETAMKLEDAVTRYNIESKSSKIRVAKSTNMHMHLLEEFELHQIERDILQSFLLDQRTACCILEKEKDKHTEREQELTFIVEEYTLKFSTLQSVYTSYKEQISIATDETSNAEKGNNILRARNLEMMSTIQDLSNKIQIVERELIEIGKEHNAQIEEKECEIQSFLRKILQSETGLSNAFSTMHDLENVTEKLQSENTDFSLQLANKEIKINLLSENFRAIEEELMSVRSEKVELETIKAQLEGMNIDFMSEIEEKDNIIQELSDQMKTTEKLQSDNTDFSLQLANKESKINLLSENFGAIEGELMSVRSEKVELETVKEQLEGINIDFISEIEKKDNTIQELSNKVKIAEKLQSDITEFSLQLANKESKINLLSENFGAIERELMSVRFENVELETVKAQLEGMNIDFMSEIEEKDITIQQLSDKVASTESEISVVQSEKSDMLYSLSTALNQISDVSLMRLKSDGCSASFDAEVNSLLMSHSHEEKNLGESLHKFRSSLFSRCEEIDRAQEEVNNCRISELQSLVNELQSKLKSKLDESTKLEMKLEQALTILQAKEMESNLLANEVENLTGVNIELSSSLQTALSSIAHKENGYLTLKLQMEEEVVMHLSNLSTKDEECDLLISELETTTLKWKEDALSLRGDSNNLKEKVALLEKFSSDSKFQTGALQADLIVARKRLKVKDQKENDLKAKMNESQKQMMIMAKSLNATCEELVAASKQLEELKSASDGKIEGMQLAMKKMNQKLQRYEHELQVSKSQLQAKDNEEASLRGKVIGFERKVQHLEENLHVKTIHESALNSSLNVYQEKLRVYEESGDKIKKKKKKKVVYV